jgi:transcriptional repressor NrdR
MKCPYCDVDNQSRVVDTSHTAQGGIRRRRECKACGRRFSTYERVLRATPMLIKSNGDREPFDREKLIHGVRIACAKRPIPASDMQGLVDEIETHLQNMGKDEVSSRVVGDMLVAGLKKLDPIAYIRYAIVYLGLDNLTSVRDMLDGLLAEQSARGETALTAAKSKPRAKAKQPSGTEASSEEVVSSEAKKNPEQAHAGPPDKLATSGGSDQPPDAASTDEEDSGPGSSSSNKA